MTRIQEADILLIDDNPDLLTLVSQALSNAGFANLRTAQTCAAARRAFAARAPQLMILDINLPDGDGFTLSGSSTPAARCRCSFFPPGMPTPTGCSA